MTRHVPNTEEILLCAPRPDFLVLRKETSYRPTPERFAKPFYNSQNPYVLISVCSIMLVVMPPPLLWATVLQPCRPPGAIGCPAVVPAVTAPRLLYLPPRQRCRQTYRCLLLPGVPLRRTGADAAAAPVPAATAPLPCRHRTCRWRHHCPYRRRCRLPLPPIAVPRLLRLPPLSIPPPLSWLIALSSSLSLLIMPVRYCRCQLPLRVLLTLPFAAAFDAICPYSYCQSPMHCPPSCSRSLSLRLLGKSPMHYEGVCESKDWPNASQYASRHKYTAQVCKGAAQQELRVCGPSLRGGTRGHDTCEISDMVIILDKHINLVYHYLMPTLHSGKVCQEVVISCLCFNLCIASSIILNFAPTLRQYPIFSLHDHPEYVPGW